MRNSPKDFAGKTIAEITTMAKKGLTACLEDEFGTHMLTWNITCKAGSLIIDGGKPLPFAVIERWLGNKKAPDAQTYFDGYAISNLLDAR